MRRNVSSIDDQVEGVLSAGNFPLQFPRSAFNDFIAKIVEATLGLLAVRGALNETNIAFNQCSTSTPTIWTTLRGLFFLSFFL